MATPTNNKKYVIINRGTGKSLYVFTGIVEGKNIIQATLDANDPSNFWIVKAGQKLESVFAPGSLFLGMSSSTPPNSTAYNAEIKASGTTTTLTFSSGSVSGYYKIKNGSGYFLTAHSTGTGGSVSGKSTTSPGNVFWAAAANNAYQEWFFTEARNDVIVTGMPSIWPYNTQNQREYFNQNAQMKYGTWGGTYNAGGTKRTKILNFYKKVYGTAPASENNYMYNLFGGRQATGVYHAGVDMYKGKGSAIKSAHSGKVSYVDTAYGAIGIYNAQQGVTYAYLHMDKDRLLKVKDADVNVGDPLGYESDQGATGRYHLHFEVRSGKATSVAPNVTSATGAMNSVSPYNYM